MRFSVPQFIEIEDKIFGPLTWKQFLYVGGGFGLAIVLFLVAPFIVFLLIGFPAALLSAALAFYPVNNRPFSAFLESMVYYFSNQREYYWHQENAPVHRSKDSTQHPHIKTSFQESNLSSLARKLELEALQKQE